MNIINKLQDFGILELTENLIWVFGQKHQPNMSQNLAKKIVQSLIEEGYDIVDLANELVEELTKGFKAVFTSQGKKKALIKK